MSTFSYLYSSSTFEEFAIELLSANTDEGILNAAPDISKANKRIFKNTFLILWVNFTF